MNTQMQANIIIQALKYIKQLTDTKILIKLGGSVLDNPILLKNICTDINFLSTTGMAVIVVHGGGKAISKALAKNKMPIQFIDGIRVTKPAAMDIIESVLCKHVNHTIVDGINKCGARALSLSGKKDNLLQCVQYSEAHDLVGKITTVNIAKLKLLVAAQLDENGPIPVIAPIGTDADGHTFNINADCAASAIASALKVHKLIFITDQDGIYDHKGALISQLNKQMLYGLIKNNTVKDGMLIKTHSLIQALEQGLDNIHIINGTATHALLINLFTPTRIGTLVKQTLNNTFTYEEQCHETTL